MTLSKYTSQIEDVKKKVAACVQLPDNVQQIRKIIREQKPLIEAERAKEKQEGPVAQKKLEEKIAAADRERKLMPPVVVDDEGPMDTLRDTKWVYQNISRLIVRNDLGLEQLNEEVLADAPSNGAIGLAHYCLNDRKAFFEKFVIKILPKDDQPDDTEPTEDDLAAEHDPSFAGLEQYLQKVENEG